MSRPNLQKNNDEEVDSFVVVKNEKKMKAKLKAMNAESRQETLFFFSLILLTLAVFLIFMQVVYLRKNQLKMQEEMESIRSECSKPHLHSRAEVFTPFVWKFENDRAKEDSAVQEEDSEQIIATKTPPFLQKPLDSTLNQDVQPTQSLLASHFAYAYIFALLLLVCAAVFSFRSLESPFPESM